MLWRTLVSVGLGKRKPSIKFSFSFQRKFSEVASSEAKLSNFGDDNAAVALKKASSEALDTKLPNSGHDFIVKKDLNSSWDGASMWGRRWSRPCLFLVVGASCAAGAFTAYENPKEARKAFDAVAHKAMAFYGRCADTGVAATILLKSMRSVLSSANEEAKLGLKMHVAALLADLSGANASRRQAIVSAGNGAVVDWLLSMVSDNSTPVIQAEAARALSYLFKDPDTCEAVLARPHAMLHLFKFIFSIRPKKKKNLDSREGRGILKGKSMLVGAIMDIVTSSCDEIENKLFCPQLPVNADTSDIAAALQVIEDGSIDLDEGCGSENDDDDSRKGMHGIGIKVLGGTGVVGISHLYEMIIDIADIIYAGKIDFSKFYKFQAVLGNRSMPVDYVSHLSETIVKLDVSNEPTKVKPRSLTEHFEYHGLWDDLQSQHVAVPLAAWAVANWAMRSTSNRSKIAELDSDGHTLKTTLMASERSVKWHGALTIQSVLLEKSLKVPNCTKDWASCLLGVALQACKAQDIPLTRVSISALSSCIERSVDAQKTIRDSGFQRMREITKLTNKEKEIQVLMVKTLEILSTGERLSLEESQKWSGILLQWIRGNQFDDTTKHSIAKVLSHILKNHGPNVIPLSQAWLALLLTDIIGVSKVASHKTNNFVSKETKATNMMQNEIVQSAAQTSTQLTNAVLQRADREAGGINREDNPYMDILELQPFSDILKTRKKYRSVNIDAADSAFATLKGIKALTELCAEDKEHQKKIIESGCIYLLRHLMISDDYEQLAAAEANGAPEVPETHEQDSSNVDGGNSSIRLPPSAHIRKHAARLLTILSPHGDASKIIGEDDGWCKWLEECADGHIHGCDDLKLRSYARSTLLNISHSKSTGSDMNRNGMCPRYEDMVFLINPESSYFKHGSYCGWTLSHDGTTQKDVESNRMSVLPEPDKAKGSGNLEEPLFSEIYDKESNKSNDKMFPAMDVVFVHGLCGGPFKTWRVSNKISATTTVQEGQHSEREGPFWPKEWLTVDFPHSRMFTVKYKTNLSQWSGATLPLEEVSSRLLKKLLAAGIGERPVVFITHSMGGLVVKQMLLQARKQGHSVLVDNTVGIAFYSCPHSGSKLADMPWRMGLVLRPAPSVRALTRGSPRLEELNNFIKQLHKKDGVGIISFLETKVTPVIEGYRGWAFRMEVVPIESAYPGYGEIVVLDGSDHVSTCKPVDRKDRAYTELLHFLESLQRKILGSRN